VRVTIARTGEEVVLMKGRRHSPEQIVRKLREADRLLAEGADVDGVCRHLEVSVQTYQRWRAQFKAMRPEDVVRLKALEKENARLKRIVGEQALDIDMLREVARGNF
jgi:putative transposase